MQPISPKPNISRVVRVWTVPPGLTFSLVEDTEQCVWVKESCPVGTHYWTLAQVAELLVGMPSQSVLHQVLLAGGWLEKTLRSNVLPQHRAIPAISDRAVPASSGPQPLSSDGTVTRPLTRCSGRERSLVSV